MSLYVCSNAAENRAHLKQQKLLNAAFLKLSKNVKHLEEENKALREEVRRAMGSPSSTSKGWFHSLLFSHNISLIYVQSDRDLKDMSFL